MRQRRCAALTKSLIAVLSGSVDSQYFVGSSCPGGHSMSNHSCGCSRARPELPPARRTRKAAKRLLRVSLVPSRQLIVWNAPAGSALASALTFKGCRRAVRRGMTGGRPKPLYGLGGSGSTPGGQTTTAEVMPTM